MKYEWPVTGLLAVSAAIFFFTASAEVCVLFGGSLLASGYVVLFFVIMEGRKTKQFRLGTSADIHSLARHRSSVMLMTALILIGVIGIEIGVRKVGGLWGNPWFVAFHLSLVMGMVVTFVIARFRYTGVVNAVLHRKLVYGFAVFYTGALITGGKLIFERFPTPSI